MSTKSESAVGLSAVVHDTKKDKSKPACWNWVILTLEKLESADAAVARTAQATNRFRK